MPVQVGVGYVDIRPDLSGFNREVRAGVTQGIGKAGDDATRSLRTQFAGVGKIFAGAFAGVQIKNFFAGAVGAASALSEQVSKSNAVFGQSAKVVEDWAATGADSFGLSKRAALEAAGGFGNMFSQLGIASDQAAGMSQQIVELAADFASFHNADISEVLLAQSAAFRGEYDALQRFLPLINAATVEQRALQLTGKATTKELTAQDKALAVNALMFEGAGDAAGDFDRTAGSLANQQRSLTAQWEDAKAELGEGLMPAMQTVVGFLNDSVIPVFRDLFSLEGDAGSFGSTLRDFFADIAGFFLGFGQQIARLAANALDIVDLIPGVDLGDTIDELRAMADGADWARDQLHLTTEELQAMQGPAKIAAAAASQFGGSAAGAIVPTKGLGAAVAGTAGKYQELSEAVGAARRDVGAAARDLADAQRGEADAQDEYNEALARFNLTGLDSDYEKLEEAGENLKDAQDGVADANDRVADANDRLGDAEGKLVEGTPAVVGALAQRASALDTVSASVRGVAESWNILAGLENWDALDAMSGSHTPPTSYPATLIGPPQPQIPYTIGPTPSPWAPSGPAGIPVRGAPTSVAPPPAPVDNRTVNINQTFLQETDPQHVAREIVWAMV